MSVNRISYIDGLRGWAAFSVMLFHIFWEALGAGFPEFRPRTISFFLNGPLAVFIFFILSGDALSAPFIKNYNISVIQKTALYRYFRLTIPITMSCFISYFLLKFNLTYNRDAAVIVNRVDWLGEFVRISASLPDVVKYATYDVYANHTTATSYNPFLWTMSTELIGSLMIFVYLILLKSIEDKMTPTIIVIIFFMLNKSYYSLFFIGVIFSLLRERNNFNYANVKKQRIISYSILIFIILYQAFTGKVGGGFNGRNIIGATMLVFAVYTNPDLRLLMQNKISHFLGRISFPLYLVHFSIIISILSFLIIKLDQAKQLTFTTALISGVISCILSILFAIIFMHIENKIHQYARMKLLPKLNTV